MTTSAKTQGATTFAKIIDLAAAIQAIEYESDNEVNAKPLHTEKGMQIMLVRLTAGAELKRHSAPGPISVQVITGEISFRTDLDENTLTPGKLLTLEANIPHSVFAKEASTILVTKSAVAQ